MVVGGSLDRLVHNKSPPKQTVVVAECRTINGQLISRQLRLGKPLSSVAASCPGRQTGVTVCINYRPRRIWLPVVAVSVEMVTGLGTKNGAAMQQGDAFFLENYGELFCLMLAESVSLDSMDCVAVVDMFIYFWLALKDRFFSLRHVYLFPLLRSQCSK